MLITISTIDPRARHVNGVELGTLRPFICGDSRQPWPCFVVSKSRGGTALTRREVRA